MNGEVEWGHQAWGGRLTTRSRYTHVTLLCSYLGVLTATSYPPQGPHQPGPAAIDGLHPPRVPTALSLHHARRQPAILRSAGRGHHRPPSHITTRDHLTRLPRCWHPKYNRAPNRDPQGFPHSCSSPHPTQPPLCPAGPHLGTATSPSLRPQRQPRRTRAAPRCRRPTPMAGSLRPTCHVRRARQLGRCPR